MDFKVARVFKLNKKIGKGAFGEIYEGKFIILFTHFFTAQHVVSKELVAVKLEPITSTYPQLEYEFNLYKLLQGQGKLF